MKNKNPLRNTLVALALSYAFCFAGTAFAAGPLAVCESGQPYLWANGGANIPFNPDQGNLGPLSNEQAVAQVAASFDVWAAVPTATVSYTNAGFLPVDVDIDNFLPYLEPVAPDGLSAIVFDDTGEIFELLYGPDSGVLGFAGPEWVNTQTCEILEGLSFLNGPAFDDVTAATDVMVHEFGHYTNLAHSVVNGQQWLGLADTSGPEPENPYEPPHPYVVDYIETMYPFYFGPGVETQTLERDDIASVSALYPDETFPSTTANASGTIYAPNGTTRITGANVIARNEAAPFEDAVSAISSDYSATWLQDDPATGTYTLFGLTPGATYRVYVDELEDGGFSTPPASPLPGPEEYYNDAESNNIDTADPPAEFTFVNAPATNIDVIFNAPQPGDALAVGDDGSVQLFMPFEFGICGESYNSVFVNANGSITFGAPSSDFSESTAEFLSGPPRIAGLWEDLNPDAAGTVTFDQDSNNFSVTFDSVPEYPDVGANSFTISLKRSANHIDIEYGGLTAAGGIAGVSCGGAVTSGFETPIDIGETNGRINLHNQPAVFEVFDANNPVDLADDRLRFTGTTNYEDNWAEPNNTIADARDISLPFNSIPVRRFTEIEPAGNDVDFYRFDATGGTTLVLQVVTGQLDSYLGLFDQDGNLVASDDDGGTGVLSRIVYEVPGDGPYYLAVTTYDDFDFSGNGGSGGRYVLDLFAIHGIVLSLEDDGSAEVTLPFSFPFQGSNYESVFVNANGNLTFGTGDDEWEPLVPLFLSGPPRIAPLWDDLSPNVGGLVYVSADATSATVTWEGVPEFFFGGSNTFSVTLREDGTVEMNYGNIDAPDNIVGITEGNNAADPGPSDLSASPTWPAAGTTYEEFLFETPNDLEGSTIIFEP